MNIKGLVVVLFDIIFVLLIARAIMPIALYAWCVADEHCVFKFPDSSTEISEPCSMCMKTHLDELLYIFSGYPPPLSWLMDCVYGW